MPQPDDNNEDTGSSAVSDLDDVQASAPADGAGSSAATDDTSDDESLLSVVRDAVKGDTGEGAASTSEDSASSAEGEGNSEQEGEQTAQDDVDYTDVPFHKHPRFQQLLREKKANQQDAERYRNVQTFLDQSGLEAEETAFGLQVMAYAKTDPQKAWQEIKPWLQNLLVAAGEVLSEDLQGRVRRGEITKEAALEISRERASRMSLEARQELQRRNAEKTGQSEARTRVMSAVETWQTDRARKDPNFEAKKPQLMREIAFLQSQEGRPTTEEGVRKQLDKAYKAVSAGFKSAASEPPKKPAIKPVTGGDVAGNQAPENSSTLDIIRAKRNRA